MMRPPQHAFVRLLVTAVRLLEQLAIRLGWVVRALWMRLDDRARLGVVIAGLVVFAANMATLAPEVSAVAEGLAVLLVAGIGLSMIVTSPFRR